MMVKNEISNKERRERRRKVEKEKSRIEKEIMIEARKPWLTQTHKHTGAHTWNHIYMILKIPSK